jgi:hypothetical protein
MMGPMRVHAIALVAAAIDAILGDELRGGGR